VVGGSEGIGAAVGRRVVRAGADLAVVSRSPEKLAAARDDLERRRTRPGQRVLTRPADVRDEDATREAVDALVADLGAPDLVVVTAGYARPGYLADLPSEHVRRMVEVNLLGTVHACRAAVPHLAAAGGGTIVTTSSLAGLAGVFGYTVYSATKFGVVGFSEALRREVRPYGITVRVLCPPNTRTPGFDEENRHKPPEVRAAEEGAGTLDPDDVAAALMRALRRRRGFLVVPGRDARLAAAVIRHLPLVADRVLRRPEPPGTGGRG
jgi:3-dehydrosphinganine reductase